MTRHDYSPITPQVIEKMVGDDKFSRWNENRGFLVSNHIYVSTEEPRIFVKVYPNNSVFNSVAKEEHSINQRLYKEIPEYVPRPLHIINSTTFTEFLNGYNMLSHTTGEFKSEEEIIKMFESVFNLIDAKSNTGFVYGPTDMMQTEFRTGNLLYNTETGEIFMIDYAQDHLDERMLGIWNNLDKKRGYERDPDNPSFAPRNDPACSLEDYMLVSEIVSNLPNVKDKSGKLYKIRNKEEFDRNLHTLLKHYKFVEEKFDQHLKNRGQNKDQILSEENLDRLKMISRY